MDFLPGFISGLARVIISYPFDYIKLHYQTNKKLDLKKITVKNLYRGATLPFFTVPIDRAITFYLYEKFKKMEYSNIVSSLLVNLFSNIYNVPIQIYNINQILKNKIPTNNLYRGLPIEYLKNILGGTIFLWSYDKTKDFSITKSNILNGLISGSLASIVNWSIIYPIDTIKTLVQTKIDETYIKIIRKRIAEEGFLSFYRGISIMYLKSIPSASIGMLMYELIKDIIKN